MFRLVRTFIRIEEEQEWVMGGGVTQVPNDYPLPNSHTEQSR